MSQNKQEVLARREFLKRAGAAAVAVGLFPSVGSFARAQGTPTADSIVTGKDARLIVHTSRPVQFETPLELLREHRITPKNIMYVRNNQDLPGGNTTAASSAKPEEWTIEVVGLVTQPVTISLAELQEFSTQEVEMVLQCSGNGRFYFSQAARASGSQWKKGAMANVRWKGIKLSTLLEAAGIEETAKFLTIEGADPAPANGADFERSVPLSDALANGIIAWEMNGEAIPAVHGGPARFILPGYYGVNNVKWVTKFRLEASETTNTNQVPRYRLPNRLLKPGDTYTFTLENSFPDWKQNLKSVIFSPDDGATVGPITEVKGVAWNDGAVPITSVELSADGGKTWRPATLDENRTAYGWLFWSGYVLLGSGDQTIMARAIDALGRSQPMNGNIAWNPNGYEWNGVESIKVKVS